ncbi:MAG: hypothetical protein R3F49_14030 [Planctomycetota bacterium]
MSEVHAIEAARRRMHALLDEQPQHALAAFAAEDPLNLVGRGAALADDEGHLLDPSDLMIEAYVQIVRAPKALLDLPGWLMFSLPALIVEVAREGPGDRITAALGRAVGIAEDQVETWAEEFRLLSLPDRRDVLALLRGGSRSFREVYPGRTFDLKRDIVEAQRTFSIFRSLLNRTLR